MKAISYSTTCRFIRNPHLGRWTRFCLFLWVLGGILDPSRAWAAAPPFISSFAPTTGPVGTEVTIEGQDLTGATAVRFNGITAIFRVGFSGNDLVATVPNGTTTGPISVVTPAGTDTSIDSFIVTGSQSPFITDFSPAAGPIGANVIITGDNFTGATDVTFNGISAFFSLFGNTITATVPDGATTGPIRVVSPAGSDTSLANFTVTAPGVPVVSNISPTSGRPGARVALVGENLDTTVAVKFNGVNAEFDVFGISVFATVPAGALTGFITVETPKGSANSPDIFTVLNPLAPEIRGLTPDRAGEGTTVSIAGTNFVGATEVRFGGVSALFQVVSNGEISAIVPLGATTGPITVATPEGTALSNESFIVPPKVLSFEPGHGIVGTPVTLRGLNFTGVIAVLFGGQSASFTVVSAVEIRTVVPEGSTTAAITVATPAGFGSSENNFLLPPKVGQFDPAGGVPGTSVTIAGENLLGVTGVQFGGVAGTFTPISLTTLVATVPEGAAPGPITVTTPAGTSKSAANFYPGLFSDVAVSLAALPQIVTEGDLLRYTITITNRGPLDASNLVVTERLPAGVKMLFSPSGASCIETNNLIICTIDSLPRGLDVNIRISSTVLSGPYLTNHVEVTAQGGDPDLANNNATLLTALEGAPPLPGGDVALAVAVTGATFEVSWPASAVGFNLESAASLVPPIAWTPVSAAPITSNGRNTVTQSAGSGTRFYRLNKP